MRGGVKRMNKPKDNRTWANKHLPPVSDKTIGIVYLIIFGVALIWFAIYGYPAMQERNAKQALISKQTKAVIDNCKGAETVGKEILEYDTYYDNGVKEVPTCRLPKTADELEAMRRSNAYKQGLSDGSIDPEDGIDEQCTAGRCW